MRPKFMHETFLGRLKILWWVFRGKWYTYGYDKGVGDMSAIVEGYHDKDGVFHVTKSMTFKEPTTGRGDDNEK